MTTSESDSPKAPAELQSGFGPGHCQPALREDVSQQLIVQTEPLSAPPEPNGLILPTAADLLPVGAPVNGVDLVVMARQVLGELAGANIPHLEGVVPRARDQEPRVRGKGALIDVGDMTAKGVYELAIADGRLLARETDGEGVVLTARTTASCGCRTHSWLPASHPARM